MMSGAVGRGAGGGILLGLLGSGEFEPWAEEVDRWLLARATGDGSVLLLPTASAPEGRGVFERWAALGREHYGRQGVTAEVLPLRTREDASRPELAARLRSASMVFFSGGNPAYLAACLRDTPFWRALLEEMERGLAYGGCSAGVAALGELAPDSSRLPPSAEDLGHPGLRLFPGLCFGPHWDALDSFAPGLRDLVVASVPEGCRLLGLDERTAIVGDGRAWTVMGAGAAWLRDGGAWTTFPSGTGFVAPLLGPLPDGRA